jgi:hypothetical protein
MVCNRRRVLSRQQRRPSEGVDATGCGSERTLAISIVSRIVLCAVARDLILTSHTVTPGEEKRIVELFDHHAIHKFDDVSFFNVT